ncbi:hypothetical protein CMI47_02275 [Candidatus Pacearchaeota archaeon]|nr:hypothetical protein [Candidatus Pacearchaeota archaeon]|tara:strand:+ start:286 stop:3072 length:2787 start_codon:yes stop_codon:yes gene_type:complete
MRKKSVVWAVVIIVLLVVVGFILFRPGVLLAPPVVSYGPATPADGADVVGTDLQIDLDISQTTEEHYSFVELNDDLAFHVTFDDRDIGVTGLPIDLVGGGVPICGTECPIYQDKDIVTDEKFGDYYLFEAQTSSGTGDGDQLEYARNSKINIDAGEVFTVSLWVKTDFSDTNTYIGNINNGPGYSITSSASDLKFRTFDGTTNLEITALNPSPNVWHHIVAGRSDTELFMYVDGVQVASLVDSSLPSLTTTRALIIGARGRGWDAKTDKGIDDVLIFERALTANEVLSLYNSDVATGGRQYDETFSGLTGTHSFEGFAVASRDLIGTSARASAGLRTVNMDVGPPPTVFDGTACGTIDTPGVYTLQKDIVGVVGTCIFIEADDVTLDLGGFKIEGDGVTGNDEYGIDVDDFDNAIIRNGEISNFGGDSTDLASGGIKLYHIQRGHTVENVVMNQVGFYGIHSNAGNNVYSNLVINGKDYGVGIDLFGGGTVSGMTLSSFSTGVSTIRTGNVISDLTISSSDNGLKVTSSGDQFTNVNVDSVTNIGIDVQGSSNVFQVIDVTNSNTGISLSGNYNRFTDVTIDGSASHAVNLLNIEGNVFKNLVITGTGAGSSDVNVNNFAIVTNLTFLDSVIDKYIFFHNIIGGVDELHIGSSANGIIDFIGTAIDPPGSTGLTTNNKVESNLATVGIDLPAEITLSGLQTGLENHEIMKDGSKCTDCVALTDLDLETVRFSVTGAGVYNVDGETPATGGGGGGGSGGGGGGSPSGGALFVNDAEFVSGKNSLIRSGQSFGFRAGSVEEEVHYIKVDEIGDEKVTITITSDPIILELGINEQKEIDLDGDGVNDLVVRFDGVVNGRAEIYVKSVTAEVVPDVEPEEVDVIEVEQPAPAEEVDYTIYYVIGGLIVLIVIVVLVLKAKKKGKRKSKSKKK